MPTRTPRPSSDPWHGVALSDIPLLDAEGTEIPLRSRVEQIAVEEAHGALASRLHRRGEVIGRGPDLVYVLFEQEYRPSGLRSNLVRLVHAAEDGLLFARRSDRGQGAR